MRRVIWLILVLACQKNEPPKCDQMLDADGDGLKDCAELDEYGTDPALADTDGDGFSDSEELDCISDPLNADELCYACGWGHNNPGNLVSTGANEGDTITNLNLLDQCGENIPLYDFGKAYHIAFLTANW